MSARTERLNLGLPTRQIAQTVCDVPSVSGDESALADIIENTLRESAHLAVTRNGDAVVARTEFGRPQRVIIAGHIDTVPINDNLPSSFVADDLGREWLVGRGSVDMKSGVAVALKLAAELDEANFDLTWIFYDHEEVDAMLNGLGRISRENPELLQADFAILAEPSNAVIEGGCNGTMRIDVRSHGVRSHSARAWIGDNAIHKLGTALDKLSAYQAPTITVDGLDYRESLSAVGISGGVAGNVIPDEAVLTVNYRFAPSTTVVDATAFLNEFFAGFEVTVVDQSAGARPGLDAPIAQSLVQSIGQPAQPKYGWTDVARFSALGIPAVNFGPGDPARAHTDDEQVLCDEIDSVEAALRSWLTGRD